MTQKIYLQNQNASLKKIVCAAVVNLLLTAKILSTDRLYQILSDNSQLGQK